jgi:hypothetical protein
VSLPLKRLCNKGKQNRRGGKPLSYRRLKNHLCSNLLHKCRGFTNRNVAEELQDKLPDSKELAARCEAVPEESEYEKTVYLQEDNVPARSSASPAKSGCYIVVLDSV